MELFNFALICENLHGLFSQMFAGSANAYGIYESFVYKEYYWLYIAIGAVCFLVFYALQAVALYKIAVNNGYEKRWMAFVPVLNTYYVGVLSQKNRVYSIKSKTMGIIASAVEGAYVLLSILSVVATFVLFNGGYAKPVFETQTYGGTYFEVLAGYEFTNLPASLGWTVGIYNIVGYYMLGIVELAVIVTQVLLYISFFQTYIPNHYFLYTLLTVLFPVRGLMMFLVRNNSAVSYRDYLAELQRRRYARYQEYMRGNNPYAGGQNDPYNRGGSAEEDPFSEYGGSPANDGKDDDPFDGLGRQ